MSDLYEQIKNLIANGDLRISEHGYDELAADDLSAHEVIAGATEGTVVEAYPDYPKGPCMLLLQRSRSGEPIHVVWGIPRGHDRPAVLVTAYRPGSDLWDATFTRRREV